MFLETMRKHYKKKKRSCGLCKPNKKGYEIRFKEKEFAGRQRAEKEIKWAVQAH